MEDLKHELSGNAMQANFSLWQSLITVNALLSSLFIAIVVLKPGNLLLRGLLFIGIITTSFTCVMLLSNFLFARNMSSRYFRHKENESKINPSKEQEILDLYNKLKYIETASIYGSAVSSTIMMWVVYIFLFKA